MKHTREELNDFIKEIKNHCRSTLACKECPIYSGSRCSICKCPDEWIELKPEKKIVPFDLSNEDDQMALIGKALRLKPEYMEQEEAFPCLVIVTSIEREDYPEVDDPEQKVWFGAVIGGSSFNGARELTGWDLFEYFTFADTGEPVGKVVKE